MDFMAGTCTLSLNCKVPTHELRKKCPGCQEFIHALCGRVLSDDEGPFKEDDVVCPKCDNSKKPAGKPLSNTTPGFQLPLFQYGFRRRFLVGGLKVSYSLGTTDDAEQLIRLRQQEMVFNCFI
jgi:hypothetical protein